jgi:hypothetical protein
MRSRLPVPSDNFTINFTADGRGDHAENAEKKRKLKGKISP